MHGNKFLLTQKTDYQMILIGELADQKPER